MAPVDGQYQLQVFAKANTTYQVTAYSFDSTGTINGITDKKGTLNSGASAQLVVQQSAAAIPVRNASLKIKVANFYDTSFRDMALISGVITPTDGHIVGSVEKNLQVKVGPFVKSVQKNQLLKYKYRGHTMYAYGALGKKGMLFQLDADTGEFSLFVGNVDLDNGDTSITADVLIQVDDVIAKNLVTFKDIRKKKIDVKK